MISTGGLVGGDSGGSLHVTLVMRGGYMRGAAWKRWQMLSSFLEAVTLEEGLSMCPLMGHMVGHCRAWAQSVYKPIILHITHQCVDYSKVLWNTVHHIFFTKRLRLMYWYWISSFGKWGSVESLGTSEIFAAARFEIISVLRSIFVSSEQFKKLAANLSGAKT